MQCVKKQRTGLLHRHSFERKSSSIKAKRRQGRSTGFARDFGSIVEGTKPSGRTLDLYIYIYIANGESPSQHVTVGLAEARPNKKKESDYRRTATAICLDSSVVCAIMGKWTTNAYAYPKRRNIIILEPFRKLWLPFPDRRGPSLCQGLIAQTGWEVDQSSHVFARERAVASSRAYAMVCGGAAERAAAACRETCTVYCSVHVLIGFVVVPATLNWDTSQTNLDLTGTARPRRDELKTLGRVMELDL